MHMHIATFGWFKLVMYTRTKYLNKIVTNAKILIIAYQGEVRSGLLARQTWSQSS